MRRILVAGGGIAGSAAALALDKAGFEVAVYEAHPETGEDIGAFLTLASNGMLALAQIGAARAVAETGFPLTSTRVADDRGAEVAVIPLGDHEDPLLRYRCLRWAELCRVLQAEVRRRGIPVHHGKRVVSVEEDAGGVIARFADGDRARADLLVGADGLNSAVRTVIDPGAPPPRYAGQRVFYGYTAAAKPPSAPGRMEMIRGGAAAFGYAVSPRGETSWFARVPGEPLPDEEIAAGAPAGWRDLLVPLLRRDATPAADIVASTGDDLMVTNARDLPEVRRWRTGRAVLIGDAAHAASPATGQGASMAVEDAVVLAKALRDLGTLDEALRAYEAVRRPRTQANIAASARMTRRIPGRDDPPPSGGTGGEDALARQLAWDEPLTAVLPA